VENSEYDTIVKTRIIGAKDVYFNDYPYMAAIANIWNFHQLLLLNRYD